MSLESDVDMVNPAEACRDPLMNIHEDLHDLIFQHVEVTKCSEVSTKWSIFIANSAKAAEKMVLNLNPREDEDDPTNSELESIINSKRTYRNIVFQASKAPTFLKTIEVLEAYKDFVVDLDVGCLAAPSDVLTQMLFPNLQSLTISHKKSLEFTASLIKTSPKLCKVVVNIIPSRPSSAFRVFELFYAENSIKELELDVSWIQFRSEQWETQHKLKLESFKTIDSEASSMSMGLFLYTQAATLQSFDAFDINVVILSTIVEKLKSLKILNLKHIHFEPSYFNNYKHRNFSLVELSLQTFSIPKLQVLLKLFPNLKVIKLLWATTRELQVIVKEGKNLEKILMKSENENCQQFYDELKLTQEDINRNIKLVIG